MSSQFQYEVAWTQSSDLGDFAASSLHPSQSVSLALFAFIHCLECLSGFLSLSLYLCFCLWFSSSLFSSLSSSLRQYICPILLVPIWATDFLKWSKQCFPLLFISNSLSPFGWHCKHLSKLSISFMNEDRKVFMVTCFNSVIFWDLLPPIIYFS